MFLRHNQKIIYDTSKIIIIRLILLASLQNFYFSVSRKRGFSYAYTFWMSHSYVLAVYLNIGPMFLLLFIRFEFNEVRSFSLRYLGTETPNYFL